MTVREQDRPIVAAYEQFLAEAVTPHAMAMDASPEPLMHAMDVMGERNLMALRCPAVYGGPEVEDRTLRLIQEMTSRRSGSFAFLVTQHQSAVSLVAKSKSETLKSALLPKMGTGERRIGIGISQLRRSGPPATTATQVDGGYSVQGIVPWVTGWQMFDAFVLGATLASGEALLALTDFREQEGMSFSAPMRLAAMESVQTVAAELNGLFIPDESVLSIMPPEWPHRNDMINIVLQGHFALGCAMAGVDQVRAAAERRQTEWLWETVNQLEAEVEACRERAIAIQSGFDTPVTDEKLAIRAWAIELAGKCAHAGIIANGGAANAVTHPAQRVYREAIVFSVSAQTPDIMEASLKRLIRPRV